MNKFWMVIRHVAAAVQPEALKPEVKHFDMGAAVAEAKRLAAKHPGETFAILETVLTVKLPFEIERPTPMRAEGESATVAVIDGSASAAGTQRHA